jgi:phage-related tail protein
MKCSSFLQKSSPLSQGKSKQLGQQPEQAAATLNNMALGVQAQFKVMARSQGLDPDLAADWIKDHRGDRVAAAVQQHTLRRDVIGAWSGLLADYKRSTGARG